MVIQWSVFFSLHVRNARRALDNKFDRLINEVFRFCCARPWNASNHSWLPSFQLATVCTFGRLEANLNFRYVECHGMPPTTRTVITSVFDGTNYDGASGFDRTHWTKPDRATATDRLNATFLLVRCADPESTREEVRCTRSPWCVKDARARWKFISVCRIRG